MEGSGHKETAQRASSGKKETWKENYFKQNDLYQTPRALIQEIVTAVNLACF